MPGIEELLKEARSKGASREQLEMLLSAYESPIEKKNLLSNGSLSGGVDLSSGLNPFQQASEAPSILTEKGKSEYHIPSTDQGFRRPDAAATAPVTLKAQSAEAMPATTGAGAIGQEMFRAVGRGLTEAIPATLESATILSEKLFGSDRPIEELASWRTARTLRSDLSQVFPRNKDLQDNFMVQTAEGLGQVGAMILARRPIAAGAMGVAQQGSMEYREALDFYKDVKSLDKEEFVKKHAKEGNDAQVADNYNRLRRKKDLQPDEEAFENWLYGSAIGATEMLPILKFLRKADDISGGTIKKIILKKGIAIGKQGVEEATQEGLAEFFSNLQARETYDQTRELLQGVGQSAKVGGAVGSILQLLMGVNTRRMQTEKDPAERAILKANEMQISRVAAEVSEKSTAPSEAYLQTEAQVAKLQDDLANPAVPQEVKADIEKEADRLDKQLEKEEALTLEDKFDEDLQTSAVVDIAAMETSLADPSISDDTKTIIQKTIDLKKKLIDTRVLNQQTGMWEEPKTEDNAIQIRETEALPLEEPSGDSETLVEGVSGQESTSEAVQEGEEKITVGKVFKNPIRSKKDDPVNVELWDEASKLEEGIGELRENLPAEEIAIDAIVPTQDYLSSEKINEKDENSELPLVIKEGGKYYVEDGHPKIASDIINGRPVKARVFDKDQYLTQESPNLKQNEKQTKGQRRQEGLLTEEGDGITDTSLKPGDRVSFTNQLKEADTGEIVEIKPNGDYVVLKSNGVKNNITGDKLTRIGAEKESKQKKITVYNASPKEVSELGKRSGVAYFAPEKVEADEYARMNGGKVREFNIPEEDVKDEDYVREKINSLGLKPKDGESEVDEATLYELIDDRFDNSLSPSDIKKLFDALKKEGVIAFKYTDGAQVSGRETESIAVIDGKYIVELEKQSQSADAKEVKTDLQSAKDKLAEAKAKLDSLNKNLGIASDPEQQAKALFAYHKALVNVAKEYIKAGAKSVKDFADALGEKVTKVLEDAWNEAKGGPVRTAKYFENRELYEVPEPPEIKRTETSFFENLKKKAFNFKENWLSYRKGLPREIWKEKEATIGEIAAQINEAKITATKLDKLLSKSKTDIGLVDKALRGDQDALTQLPQDIALVVQQMRAHIDSLSQYLIDNGLVSEGRQEIIASNIGEYLNRSYKLFNSKDWTLENVPEQIYNKAAQFLYKEYYPDIKAQMPGATDAEVNAAVVEQVKAKINEYFNKGENAFVGNKKIGAKDLAILKRRKDVPPELRALFGEVTDPINNYVQTVFKMANLAGNAAFLTKIKEDNLGTLFFEKGDPKRPETHHVEIASEGSDTMSPLNGLYTTEELAEVFKEQSAQTGPLAQMYLRFVGLVKAGKTVGSVVTHIKNVEGNVGIALANGHLDMSHFGEALMTTRADFLKQDKAYAQEIIQKLIKKGVLNQNIFASEVREMFDKNKSSEAFFGRSAGRNRNFWEKTKFYAGKAADRITKLYESEDNFFKILGYLQDRQRYGKALHGSKYENLTPEQQGQTDTYVTEIIKDTYPTWSRVPKIARVGSSFGMPVFGNFVSFAAESYRIQKNLHILAAKEALSSNPKIRKIGAQRIVGLGMYYGLKYALLKAGTAGLAGIADWLFDDEEERKNHANAIKYVAPWSRNSDLMVLQSSGGKLKYIDMSAYDPFGNSSSIINAATNPGDADGGKPGQIVWEFIQPFADLDMTGKTGIGLFNNENNYGNKIWEDADDPETKVAKGLEFALKSLEPGTISTIRRLYDKDKNQSKEFGAMIYRTTEVDVAKAFSYKARDHKEQLASINKTYTNVYYDKDATEKQKQDELDKANVKANVLLKEMYADYKAALELGVKAEALGAIMKAQRFNRLVSGAVMLGKDNVKGIVKKKPTLVD